MMYAIEVQDAYYRYLSSEDFVLKGINLKVKKGEFVSIMGPTGAGKSTLCLTLNGIIPHFLGGELVGRVKILGRDTRCCDVPELAQKVGLVFEEPESQLFCTNVEDEVAFGPENLGIPPTEIRKRIDWALQVVRMIEYKHKSPFKLSGGQMQRVAIAATLSMLPEILVLDEPISGLDPIGKMEVLSVLGDLKKRQEMTIIMVEHESEEIAKFSDRVIILDEGKIISDGGSREVLGDVEKLKRAKLCPPQVCELAATLNGRWGGKTFSFLTLEEATEGLRELFVKPIRTIKTIKNKESKVKAYRSEPLFYPNSGNHPIISAENLCFAYEETDNQVLKNISLKINPGDFIAIIGQNGSGKTTLVKHFNGILKPTRGDVYVENINTRERTVAELSRKVGYAYQNPDHQIFCPTVEEEVTFGLKNLGLSEQEIEERTENSLRLMGLGEIREKPPAILGLGERRKVSLASVVSMKTPVLILDEPTTGVDWGISIGLMETMRELNEKGHTIIVITHNMRIAAEYANRTVVMGNGEILLDSSPREVFSQRGILKKAFLVPPQITQLGQSLHVSGMPVLSCEEFYHIFSKLGVQS